MILLLKLSYLPPFYFLTPLSKLHLKVLAVRHNFCNNACWLLKNRYENFPGIGHITRNYRFHF